MLQNPPLKNNISMDINIIKIQNIFMLCFNLILNIETLFFKIYAYMAMYSVQNGFTITLNYMNMVDLVYILACMNETKIQLPIFILIDTSLKLGVHIQNLCVTLIQISKNYPVSSSVFNINKFPLFNGFQITLECILDVAFIMKPSFSKNSSTYIFIMLIMSVYALLSNF